MDVARDFEDEANVCSALIVGPGAMRNAERQLVSTKLPAATQFLDTTGQLPDCEGRGVGVGEECLFRTTE